MKVRRLRPRTKHRTRPEWKPTLPRSSVVDYWRSNNRSCRQLTLIDIDWARQVKVWRLRPRTKHITGPEWKSTLPKRSVVLTNPWTVVSAGGLEATVHPG